MLGVKARESHTRKIKTINQRNALDLSCALAAAATTTRSGFNVVAAFGGLSKLEQVKALKAGSDAAVATPGRLIDLVRLKVCAARRRRWLLFFVWLFVCCE